MSFLPNDPRGDRAIHLLRVILTAETQAECDGAMDEAEELLGLCEEVER